MLLRALLLLAAMLLLTAALASVLTPRDLRQGRGARTLADLPQRTVAAEPRRDVTAELPGKDVVVAEGDVVSLRIASDTPDIAEVLALGLTTPVGPGLPGELLFVADQPGRFAVHLQLADMRAGVVVVRARAGT